MAFQINIEKNVNYHAVSNNRLHNKFKNQLISKSIKINNHFKIKNNK
jgi:hypothetical protein